MKYFFYLFLWPLLSSSFAKTPETFEVIFDQSLEQVYSPFDTGFAGLSRFSILIKKMGGEVSLNSRPLSRILLEISSEGKILILGPAMFKSYKKEDLTAIDNFIKKGGGVLVLVEHDDLFKNATFQNQLIEKYGIKALPESAISELDVGREKIWPKVKSKLLELENLSFYLPALLKIQKPAKVLASLVNTNGLIPLNVGAIRKDEKGSLIVLGDIEILWNMTVKSGIRNGNNQKFLEKVIGLLKGKTKRPNLQKKPKSKPTQKKILFYSKGWAQGPSDSLSGLSKLARAFEKIGYSITQSEDLRYPEDFKLIIWANPLKQIKVPKALLKSKKLLLIGDGQSDVLKAEKRFRRALTKSLKLKINSKEYLHPLNSVLKYYDLNIFSGSLVSQNKNHFFYNQSVTLKRASYIYPIKKMKLKKNDFREMVSPDLKAHYTFVPLSDSGKSGLPFKLSPKIAPPGPRYLIYSNKKVFIISDMEPLSNQFFNDSSSQKIFSNILLWLKNQKGR